MALVFSSTKFDLNKITTRFDPNKKGCRGVFFRGKKNVWFDYHKGRLVYKQELRLLKRISCDGCQDCGWIFDQMSDMIGSDGIIYPKYGIEEGKMYTIAVTNESRDWETGIVDNWDFKIVEVEENEVIND